MGDVGGEGSFSRARVGVYAVQLGVAEILDLRTETER